MRSRRSGRRQRSLVTPGRLGERSRDRGRSPSFNSSYILVSRGRSRLAVGFVGGVGRGLSVPGLNRGEEDFVPSSSGPVGPGALLPSFLGLLPFPSPEHLSLVRFEDAHKVELVKVTLRSSGV